MLPNLIVPGMTKCGTTALHEIFYRSQFVYVPKVKECRFFTRHVRDEVKYKINNYSTLYFETGFNNIDEYESLFDNEFEINADISNDYSFFSYEAISDIKRTYKEKEQSEPKILLIVKKPSTRIVSQYLHNVRTGVDHRELSKAIHISNFENNLVWTMDYQGMLHEYKTISDWCQSFGDVKIISWNDLFSDEGLNKLALWLDVENDFLLSQNFKKSESLLVKSKVHSVILRYAYLLGLFFLPMTKIPILNRVLRPTLSFLKQSLGAFALKPASISLSEDLIMHDESYSRLIGDFKKTGVYLN